MYVMVTVPPETPVMTPLPDPAVAIDVLLLIHVPELETSARVMVDATHTGVLPVIAAGSVLTVTVAVAAQPARVYDIVVVAGAATPDTIPEDVPMVAAAVLVLVQTPPEGVLDRVAVPPRQTLKEPLIAAGEGDTLTTVVV